MVHELKILPEYFNRVKTGTKRFELRKNDRDFHAGDMLCLREWDGNDYTGDCVDVIVTFILFEYEGLVPGWCVMSIELTDE